VLADVNVTGTAQTTAGSVRDKVDLLVGQPLDPAKVARAVQRIDSVYQSRGFYLARIRPESTFTSDGRVRLMFPGRRGAAAGDLGGSDQREHRAAGQDGRGRDEDQARGFFWWRKGAFDEEKYAGDLAERLPGLYASRGFVDFQILQDTVVVDREQGKAYLDITVREGPQYKIGEFEIVENRRFSTEDLARYYPFNGEGPTLTERVVGLTRGRLRAPTRTASTRRAGTKPPRPSERRTATRATSTPA
jgi:outer membrane protein insertion porin family